MSNEASISAGVTMKGFGGDITVELTVKDGRIADCRITGDDETPDT